MASKKLLSLIYILAFFSVSGQQNLLYTPEKPEPGDTINFIYKPSANLSDINTPMEGIMYQIAENTKKVNDISIIKRDGKFYGSLITDTTVSLVNLVFKSENLIDNNNNEGYTILLYEKNLPRPSAYFSLGKFYQTFYKRAGIKQDNEKAIMAMEKEFDLYPDSKMKYLTDYVKLKIKVNAADAMQLVQGEIESILKKNRLEEIDYSNIENLYSYVKLSNQQQFIVSLKKKLFPEGNWLVLETLDKYYSEQNIEKKKIMLKDIKDKIENYEIWKPYKKDLFFITTKIIFTCIENKDWINFKKAIQENKIEDKLLLYGMYNDAANKLLESDENLELAEEFASLAASYFYEQWKNPSDTKPDLYTQKEWIKDIEGWYAIYADTYARVLYRKKEYKKGFRIARDAAMVINKGKNPEFNDTYALLAAKISGKRKYIKELEQFVIDGEFTDTIIGILKQAYGKNKSEKETDGYIDYLKNFTSIKMREELARSKLNMAAPDFILRDLKGNSIQLRDLFGKTIIIDFWATWCGPCIGSFPAMQNLVNKYKDHENIKFLFIDTGERIGQDKEKNASDLLAKNKYSFQVLMDNDNSVAAKFKVSGLPTKFVIDKKGMIRFRQCGFDGNNDKLINEMTMMIEMTNQ